MTAAPAHALGDPLVEAHATVLPSQINSIVTVCLQIRPSPMGCITI